MSDEANNPTPINFTEEDLAKLGLNEDPFSEHAGDAYLYSDAQLDMTSNVIMEYLSNPTTTIVLTGEEGLGKTTFLRKVLRIGYQQYHFCTLRAGISTTFDDIQSKIKQRWVLQSNEDKAPVSLSIENYVITYLREHTHVVLIVDDAENLDMQTLDRLFTLKHRIALACPNGLGLILAGESPLVNKISELEESNPACTQVYQINVRPLTREQLGDYIKFRLTTAGLEEEMLLHDAQLDEIYTASGGNIKLSHQYATNLLQTQVAEDTSFSDTLDEHITIVRPKPRVPIVLISLILLLGIGLYIGTNRNKTETTSIELTTPNNEESTSETITPLAKEAKDEAETTVDNAALPKISKARLEPLELKPILEPELKSKVDSLPLEELKTLEDKLTDVLEQNKTEQSNEQLANAPESQKEQTTVATNNKPVDTPEKINKQTSELNKSTHGVAWLKQLDKSNYTLQVVATTDHKKLDSLIKAEKLSEDYASVEKLVKGQKYFVLVVGDYKTRDEAISSAKELPESLRKNNPWPIKIEQVQQFIN